MLNDDVVEAVKEGTFHIYPVSTVDENRISPVSLPERKTGRTYPRAQLMTVYKNSGILRNNGQVQGIR